ncbi:AAA family ATPase [Halonotius sp. F2-221B]|uniref:TrlF family AAA-like ATPase n=1 Tax=Halonotius sp. F2-221B TaxID=2731620 RepID=UPI00398A9351
MSLRRGSQWGKWDLHVHTPLSFESQFGMSEAERKEFDPLPELEGIDKPERYEPQLWTKYVRKLEEIDNIDCIGITDYFSIEGYELLRELKEEDYLNNFDLMLPNIEFRLDTITGDHNRINLHVIFSDDISIDHIKREFLQNLKIKIDEKDEYALSTDSLKRLGRKAKEIHDDENLSDYVAGCKYARVKLDEILEELNNTSVFDGKYLIVLSGAEWHQINWDSQDADKKRQLLATSHGLFSGNQSDREWAIGEGPESKEDIREALDSLKPVFHASDSHDFDSLCVPNDERYCWLKANHSFEGLKQVVFEPIERMKIDSTSPKSFTQIQTIDSLSISDGYVNNSLSVEENTIPFNSNLVTVIGSQGSGKTALLDFIANCFQTRTKEGSDDDNSFIARIENSNPYIKTELEFTGEDIEGFSKEVLEPRTVEGPNISYIPQGKIVEYCEKGGELHDQIMKLVKQSVADDVPAIISIFNKKESEIDSLADDMRRLNAELHEINPPEVRETIQNKKTELNEKNVLLSNKQTEIEEFKQKHEKELEETEAEELQDSLDDLQERLEDIEGVEEYISKAKDKINSIEQVNSLIEEINSKSELFEFEIDVEKVRLDNQKEALQDLSEKVNNSKQELQKEIDEVREDIDELSEIDEELSKLRDDERRIKTEIEQIQENISKTEEELDKINDLIEERTDRFVEYVKNYIELKSVYEDIAEEFANGEGNILSEVEIEPSIEFSANIASDFENILDMRSINSSDISEKVDSLKPIIKKDNPNNVEEQIREYINQVEELRDIKRSSKEPIEFDGLLYDDYLKLTEEIYYQGTQMDQLSRGQKGTILLKIYLAEGENPLIIDSPEDNLDNRFVYDELIDAVREAKTKRQIFVATHDANLVINTDSEQVIVTEFDQGTIKYKAGALEEERIRSEAKDILEGGDEAFRRRNEKYNLLPK